MKKLDRRAALVLAGVLTATALTGCDDTKSSSESSSGGSSSSSTAAGGTESGSTESAGTESAGTESADAGSSSSASATGSTAATTSAPAASSSAAATTVTSADKQISLALPAGWSNNTAAAGESVVLSAKAEKPIAGFSPVLIVTSSGAPGGNLAALVVNTGKEKATQTGGTYKPATPRTIAGVSAPGYTVESTQDGTKLVHREHYVVKSGKLYIVTMTSAAGQATAADAQFDGLLKGWTWAK